MNAASGSLEKRLWFFIFIAPALALLTLFVSFVGGGVESIYLPVVAIVGFALSALWKWRGLFGALLILSGAAFLSLHGEDVWMWHSGLALSLALGFVITVLSFAEVSELVCHVHWESRTNLQRFLHLDEEYKRAEQSWQATRCELEGAASLARDEIKRIAKNARREEIEKLEIENLEKERSALIEEVRRLRGDPPNGHFRESIKELEERLEETQIELAEERRKNIEVDEMRHQLEESQNIALERAGLRDELNRVRVESFQMKLDIEQRPDIQTRLDELMRSKEEEALKPRDEDTLVSQLLEGRMLAEEQVSDLEEVVGTLLSELQKRSAPFQNIKR